MLHRGTGFRPHTKVLGGQGGREPFFKRPLPPPKFFLPYPQTKGIAYDNVTLSGGPGKPVRACALFAAQDARHVDSGLGSDTFNKVLWECGGDGRPCRVERGAEDGLLQASKDWFAGKRPRDLLELPGMALPPATERPFTVWASAEDKGALNRQRTAFGRNGYGIGELETGMALPLNRWTPEGRPPEGLRIVQVGTSAELSAYADVLAANWNPPDEDVKRLYKAAEQVLFQAVAPMRLFVGFAGEVPVVSGELFLSEKGNTAGLHMISTREAFRRRGFGGAMTAALLRAGQAAGASLAVLQASSEGEPVYRRQGFEPCGLFVEYVLSEEILF